MEFYLKMFTKKKKKKLKSKKNFNLHREKIKTRENSVWKGLKVFFYSIGKSKLMYEKKKVFSIFKYKTYIGFGLYFVRAKSIISHGKIYSIKEDWIED